MKCQIIKLYLRTEVTYPNGKLTRRSLATKQNQLDKAVSSGSWFSPGAFYGWFLSFVYFSATPHR